MQRRVAGCARAVALLGKHLTKPTSRGARIYVHAIQRDATCCRVLAARVTARMRPGSWRIGSQLVHASTIAPQPPQPADGVLDHDVDVLIEGAPLSVDRCAAYAEQQHGSGGCQR